MAWRDRQNRGEWSSSPNMWKDPKTVTGKKVKVGKKKKNGCVIVIPFAVGGVGFVYEATQLVIDWVC